MPLTGEEALQRAWQRAAGPGELRLQCQVSGAGGGPGRGCPALLPVPSLPYSPPPCRREWAAGLSSTRWWPGTATPPRGQRTWPCSRETPWTSCAKVELALPPHRPAGGPGANAVSASRCGDALTPPAVDQAWLEGHCDGRIGIFPKCFVVPAIRRT